MTGAKLKELFERHDGEHGCFERVVVKLHPWADLHAFLLLAKLFPGVGKVIGGVGYQEVVFRTVSEDDDWPLSEGDVADLVRCGVWFDGDVFRRFV